jgi:predicted nucleic acid-binding protein
MFFLDANIVLEILFKRENANFCIEVCKEQESLFISSTSLHTIYYYAEKAKIDLDIVKNMLADINILPVSKSEYDFALEIFQAEDMEDALQVATALNFNIKLVFTLDKAMIKKYSGIISFVTL